MSTMYTTDAMPSPPRQQKESLDDKEEFTSKQRKKPNFNEKQPSINMLNISNASNIRIGTTVHFHGNNNKPDTKLYPTAESLLLKKITSEVTRDDIVFLSQHIGKSWVWVARHYKYSDGQIETFQHANRDNLRETIYQFLRDLKQTINPTVGSLATALESAESIQALNVWSEERYSK